MEPRRLTGWLALIVVICAIAVLLYFDMQQKAEEPLPAAVSTSEPPADDAAGEAPAPGAEAPTAPADSATAEAPAAETPAPAPPTGAPAAAVEAPAPAETPAAAETTPAPADVPAVAETLPPAPDVATAEPTAPAPAEAPPEPAGSPAAGEAAPPPALEGVPSFDIVRVEPTGETVVAGQAAPKARVEILDGGDPIAVAEANESGEWAMALDKPLPAGSHDLAIRTTSEDKKTVTLSDQRVAVAVPSDGSKDVLVVLNAPDAASRVLQVPVAESGEKNAAGQPTASGPTAEAPPPAEAAPAGATGAPETAIAAAPEAPAAQSDPEAQPAQPSATGTPTGAGAESGVPATDPGKDQAIANGEAAPAASPAPAIEVGAVEADTSGALYVAGTTNQAGPVRIYIDDQLIGEAMPNESGNWLLRTKRDLPAGKYRVRADEVDAGTGQVVVRAEVPFEREVEVAVLKPAGETGTAASGATPQPQTIVIKRGDNLWRLSRAWYGKGVRWSTLYAANKDQIRNPRWIYPGQVFTVPAGDTTWKQ